MARANYSSHRAEIDAHLDVDIRAMAAVLAAQIDALIARRRRGVAANAELLVARPSENFRQCMSCLAHRLSSGMMAVNEVPTCVATPMLFQVIEGISDAGGSVASATLVMALERLSAVMQNLPALDEERLIKVRDFLIEASNDRRCVHQPERSAHTADAARVQAGLT